MLTYVTVTDSSGHRTELPFSSLDSALAYAMDIMEHNDTIVQTEVHNTPRAGHRFPFAVGDRVKVGRNGRNYTGRIIRIGANLQAMTVITIEFYAPGGRGAKATASATVGIDSISAA